MFITEKGAKQHFSTWSHGVITCAKPDKTEGLNCAQMFWKAYWRGCGGMEAEGSVWVCVKQVYLHWELTHRFVNPALLGRTHWCLMSVQWAVGVSLKATAGSVVELVQPEAADVRMKHRLHHIQYHGYSMQPAVSSVGTYNWSSTRTHSSLRSTNHAVLSLQEGEFSSSICRKTRAVLAVKSSPSWTRNGDYFPEWHNSSYINNSLPV